MRNVVHIFTKPFAYDKEPKIWTRQCAKAYTGKPVLVKWISNVPKNGCHPERSAQKRDAIARDDSAQIRPLMIRRLISNPAKRACPTASLNLR